MREEKAMVKFLFFLLLLFSLLLLSASACCCCRVGGSGVERDPSTTTELWRKGGEGSETYSASRSADSVMRERWMKIEKQHPSSS